MPPKKSQFGGCHIQHESEDMTQYAGPHVRPGLNPRLTSVGLAGCFAAPVLFAYAMLIRFGCNMPVADDYHEILGFSLGWQQAPTALSKLLFLASYQHVDYKLVFQEQIFAAELALTNHINFGFLVFAGNLFY